MDSQITIYQTLQDRDNHIECEEEGPFSCAWDNTWLGTGYYFWYHHIKLAHWWGGVNYGNEYVIYKSICNNFGKCWDLHSNGGHQDEFLDWLKKLEKRGLLSEKTCVSHVINFIKGECNSFEYEAIRILGIDSLTKTTAKSFNLPRLPFEKPKTSQEEHKNRFKSYFDLIPPVQICLFKKTSLNREGFEVVYPDEYREDYEVVF